MSEATITAQSVQPQGESRRKAEEKKNSSECQMGVVVKGRRVDSGSMPRGFCNDAYSNVKENEKNKFEKSFLF